MGTGPDTLMQSGTTVTHQPMVPGAGSHSESMYTRRRQWPIILRG
jgi:hypothetical protein